MAIDWSGVGASAAYDIGTGAVSQGIGFGLNAAAASKAWDRQKKLIKRGPTWMMQGLHRAGINPILAAEGVRMPGASMAPHAAAARSSAKGDPSRFEATKMISAQTLAAEKTADKMEAEASLARVRGELESLDAPRRLRLKEYYESPLGQRTVEQGEFNRSLPNSWESMLMKEVKRWLEDRDGAAKGTPENPWRREPSWHIRSDD